MQAILSAKGLALVVESSSGNAQNPFIPPVFDIVWSVVAIAIVALIMIKWVIPKFNQVTAERQAKIQEGFDLTEKVKADSKDAEKKVEAELAKAREQATKIREDANAQAQDTIARSQVKANEEAKRIVENAHRQIEAERQAAQLSLRADVGLLAMELAEKIVGEHLKDKELSARVVDRFLDDLEKQSTASKA